jgi:hypothetical protein
MIPAIITISVLVGLYLLTILVVISQLVSIDRKLKRREHGINVILAQKFDLLVTLGNFMEDKGAKLPENIKDALIINDYSNLKTINTYERLSVKNLLSNTLNTMFYIAEEHGMRESEKYITLKNSLKDVDNHHRKEVALYNADATAYNYWVKTFFFRPISKIFKIKEKEIMY